MSRRPRILCVDDRQDSLLVRRLLLEQFGCEVVVAVDVSGCLSAAARDDVDLVVIDYHLADGAKGDDLAKDIRVSNPTLPLIMLTGDPMIPQAARASVDAVLIKGASNPSDLLATIQKLLPKATVKQPHTPVKIS